MRKIRRKAKKLNDGTANELVYTLWNEKDRAVAAMQAELEGTVRYAYHKGRIQGLLYAIHVDSCWNNPKVKLNGLKKGIAEKALASLDKCQIQGMGNDAYVESNQKAFTTESSEDTSEKLYILQSQTMVPPRGIFREKTMGDKSGIELTDATWNPVTGCTKVSPACDHCWAERMANRLKGRYGYPADKPFRVTMHPDRLHEPLR